MEVTNEQLKVIEHVAAILAPKFVAIPGYDIDDIMQECRIYALELVAKNTYDASRGPFENYCMTHVRRRLLNLQRDHLARPNSDSPCRACQEKPCPQAAESGDKHCKPYKRWFDGQQNKLRVRRPQSIDYARDDVFTEPSTTEVDAEIDEVRRFLDDNLSIDNRRILLQLRAGMNCTRPERIRLMVAIIDLGIDAPSFLDK